MFCLNFSAPDLNTNVEPAADNEIAETVADAPATEDVSCLDDQSLDTPNTEPLAEEEGTTTTAKRSHKRMRISSSSSSASSTKLKHGSSSSESGKGKKKKYSKTAKCAKKLMAKDWEDDEKERHGSSSDFE
jgi:hypothetical protein